VNWYEAFFDNDGDESWFAQMDDPNHVRLGLANLILPWLKTAKHNYHSFRLG
jgi:hypothetical protein